MKTLQAEKVSTSETVFNASDLANASFIKDKKINDEPQNPETENAAKGITDKVNPELTVRYKMSVYPNPVAKGDALYVRFNNFPQGRYNVQLIDVNGKRITEENMNIGGRMQLYLLQLPKSFSTLASPVIFTM